MLRSRAAGSLLAFTVWLALAISAAADTGTSSGDRSGEGSTPFTGLAQAPEANLFTGALTTALAIDVPPGRAGMTPQLALQYSSGAGPGPFGYGWDLSLGRIERSSAWGTPRCSGPHTDDFVLVLPTGSAELVREAPASKYYRPKVEQAWVRAERFEQDNRWQVVDRSGRIYSFGDVDSARLGNSTPLSFLSAAADGTCRLTSVWALTRVEDPNGNTMQVAWSKVLNTLYPATVRWGGNTAAGIEPIYTVRFLPEWRPETDRLISQRLGVSSRLAWRIYGIDVESDRPGVGTLVRSYTLQYQDGDGSGPAGYQSMLAAVGVTGRPTQHFVYTPSVTGHALAVQALPKPTNAYAMLRKGTANADVAQTVLDMNGDGMVDLVRSDDAPASSWSVYWGAVNSNGTFGFAGAATAWQVPGSWAYLRNVDTGTSACGGNGWTCTRVDTLDITGDGIPDYVDATSPSAWTVYAGRGVPQWGFAPGVAWPAPNQRYLRRTWKGDTFQEVVDINGDGLPDLVKSGGPNQPAPYNWLVYLNTGSGFEAAPLPRFPAPVNTIVDHVPGGVGGELIDFNGDGLPDIVRSGAGSTEMTVDARCQASPMVLASCLEVYFNTGQGFGEMEPVIPVPPSSTLQESLDEDGEGSDDGAVVQDVMDINGDGLPDWLYRRYDYTQSGFANEWRVLLNLGGRLEPLQYVTASVSPVFTEGIAARVWSGAGGYFRRNRNGDTRSDLIDVNGDGFLDHIEAGTDAWTVRLHAAREHPNLLGLMENGLGGTNTVLYRPSTAFDNSGGDAQPDLPFVQWVAAKTRQSDGLCTPPAGADLYTAGAAPAANPCIDAGHELVVTYDYQDGRFDAADREFRGFRRVVRSVNEGSSAPPNRTATVFAQDATVKGRVLSVDTYAGASTLVHNETNLWGTRSAGSGRTQIWLAEQRRMIVDGGGTLPRYSAALSDPPDAYGNITHHWQVGLLGAGRVDTYTTYAAPSGTSLVSDKPASVRIEDASGVLQEKWFFYDGSANGLGLGKVAKGNLKRERQRRSLSDTGGTDTKLAYDSAGNVRLSTDANGNATTTVYDDLLLYPISVTNELGHVTSTEIDYRWGKPTRVTDPNGAVTSYQYDDNGRPTCVMRPGDAPGDCSVTTAYHFAVAPGLSWVERAERQDAPHPPAWTRQYVDALGRPRYGESSRVVAGAPVVVRSNETDYDAAGRIIRQTHPYISGGASDGRTTFEYRLNGGAANDPLGRVHITTASDDTRRTVTYLGNRMIATDEEGQRTETTVDGQGRVLEERHYDGDALVVDMAQQYDGLGRVIAVRQNDSTTKSFQYDTLGRKVAMTDRDSGTWRYGYDDVGNLIWQDDPKSGQHVEICYDALQRPLRRCPYSSDFTKSASCRAACADPDAVFYTYDAPAISNARGRLTRIDDGSGSTETTGFDARGRVLGRIKTIVVDGESMHARFAYTYDRNDRVTSVVYPDNEDVRTEYDDAGQPIALYNTANTFYVTDAEYDLFGRPTLIQHANGVADTRSYANASGQHRLATLRSKAPQGAAVLDLAYAQYSPRGLLRAVSDLRNPSGDLTNSATFSYDALGRLLVADSPTNSLDRSFAYDAMGNMVRNGDRQLAYANAERPHQLTRVDAPAGATNITHDANGNRMGKAGQSYLYDSADRIVRVDAGGDSVRFVYDADGQVVAKVVEALASSLSRYYDARVEVNRGWMTKWYLLGDQRVASFTSPYSGWQIASLDTDTWLAAASLHHPGLIIRLAAEARWMIAALLLTLCAALLLLPGRRAAVVGIRVRPGHAIGVALLCAIGTLPWPVMVGPQAAWAGGGGGGTVLLHHHVDHLGSTQVITSASGSVVEQIRYAPYGALRGRWGADNQLRASSAMSQSRDFTGYQSDNLSGLTCAGARFYDPEIGSFLTHDPQAQFTSPYSYGGGDPVNWSDPNGEFFIELLVAIGVGVAASAAINSVIAAARGLPLSAIGKAAVGGAIAGAVGVGIGVVVSAAAIGAGAVAGTIQSNVTLASVQRALQEVAFRSAFSTTAANAAGETLDALGAPTAVARLGSVLAGYASSIAFDQGLLYQGQGKTASGVVEVSNAATHSDLTRAAAEQSQFTPQQVDLLVESNRAQDLDMANNQTHFDYLARQEFERAAQDARDILRNPNASRTAFVAAVGRASHYLQDQYALGHIVPGTHMLGGPVGAPLRLLIHQTVGGEVTFRGPSYEATRALFGAARNFDAT